MLWWLTFLFNGAVRGTDILPLQMASLYTERHTVLVVPHSDSAKHFKSTKAQLFCQLLRRSWLFVRKNPSPRGTVNSWFVIISDCLLIDHTFFSSTLKCDSQWKPVIQDIQAQEEYPGGFTSVRAVETCRSYTGKWKPAHGSHVAWGWRLKWVGRSQQ